jgi:hypothetical protein
MHLTGHTDYKIIIFIYQPYSFGKKLKASIDAFSTLYNILKQH